MDEKTAMTVEFLRARLLSERNVSRTARQRAEVFAKRVMDLEEQLRIVNSQRKKAEKAAEDVLAILETQGITCISELTDSSTEQEDNNHILCEDAKDKDYLTFSDLGKSEVDDGIPLSEIDDCHAEHKNLSWKFQSSGQESHEKHKAKQNKFRYRGDFAIELKSSQHRLGKSCRKIKRLDARLPSENELRKGVHDSHGNGMFAMSDNFHGMRGYSSEVSESKIPQFSIDSSVSSSIDDQNGEENNFKRGNDDGMERALEQQAQLIDQFQAMENAQREWEEKFNDSKISLQDNQNGNPVGIDEKVSFPVDNSSRIQQLEGEKLFVKDTGFTDNEKSGACQNCETLNKREVASDKFLSPDKLSTSPSSFSKNGFTFNGCSVEVFNEQCGAAAVNEIEAVHEVFTFSTLDRPELTNKGKVGPIFETNNAGFLHNSKLLDESENGVLHWSSKKHHDLDNKKVIVEREQPKISKEHPKHLSQARRSAEQQYATMTTDESSSNQSFRFPLQGSPSLVASNKDLHGPAYMKQNEAYRNNLKAKFSNGPLMLQNSSKEQFVPIVHERDLTEIKELPSLSSKGTNKSLASVLQSLQHARISIKQELAKQPSLGQGTLMIAQPSKSPVKPIPACKALDVPICPPGLFSLPTDSIPKAHYSGANFYGSALRLTAARPDLDLENSLPPIDKEYFNRSPGTAYMQAGYRPFIDKDYDDRCSLNPYVDGISKSQNCNAVMNRYLKSGSRVGADKDYFDRNSSSSFSASSAVEYPHYYSGLSTNRHALQNELPKSSSDWRNRIPYRDGYSYGRDYYNSVV